MRKAVCLIFAMLLIANASPLLWRGAKCMSANSAIFMGGFSYSTSTRRYDWANEEWDTIPDASQTDVIGMHFMLGYAPIANWEIMAHIPVMMKSRDTLTGFGLQDAWIKTRYQFIGGKNQPYLTGLLAVRFPTSDDQLDIVLDDQTIDIAAGALFMYNTDPVVFHLKAGYWYNMKNDVDVDIGDQFEGIGKVDYKFSKQFKAFLNINFMYTLQAKDSSGTSLDNTEQMRLLIIPGAVIMPTKGLSIRPKFIYPLEMVNMGGSSFQWKVGLDIWYVAKFGG